MTFSEYIVKNKVIEFGDFILKSGRKSPYFFNFGLFNNGKMLDNLGEYYADAIIESGIDFDIIFGSAYKGIPIALATVIALRLKYGINKSYTFNRKEVKEHGDKGIYVGSDMKNKKVLSVDDVLTSGKTTIETNDFINRLGGKLVASLVALDRCEQLFNDSKYTAKVGLKNQYSINVISIANIDEVLHVLNKEKKANEYKKLKAYIEGIRKNV
ncbi:orotate phosphoribosyltransferase [Staphylococcus simulans]|uniref:Orotate phosphoribosyltransferase n=1 Tax=Staphylococcus simulans TaxID=1286 RepID=A0A6N2Z004_STASI